VGEPDGSRDVEWCLVYALGALDRFLTCNAVKQSRKVL
jgi:hypothetical protein